jgi:hypothetical protein
VIENVNFNDGMCTAGNRMLSLMFLANMNVRPYKLKINKKRA